MIKFPKGSSLSRSLLMRGSLLRLWIRRKLHLILYVLKSNLTKQRKTVSVLQRGVFERGNPLVFVYRLFVFPRRLLCGRNEIQITAASSPGRNVR